jgi:DNA-binding transcriptional ArsR family regulator
VILSPESVARFAGLLADRSRAAMCLALLDGRAWTAGELARQAGVAAPTASEHLNQLVGAGVLAEERQGRHRYLRLASPDIARLLEDLASAGGQPAPARSLRTVRAAADLAAARTCYDHLAGALGVGLFDALVARDLVAVADGLTLTAAGRSWFTDLAGPEALQPSRSRPLLRTCLDWTERKPHLAGQLGAVLYRQFVARSWVRPAAGSRAVRVTPAGGAALSELFGAGLAGCTPPAADPGLGAAASALASAEAVNAQ